MLRSSFLALAFSVCLLGTDSLAQVKKPAQPEVKIPFAESKQAIVVTTPGWTATQGIVWLFERKSPKSVWKSAGESFPVVVGRTGLAWDIDSAPESPGEFKKEGDGKSPAGLMSLTFAFGSGEAAEGLMLPYRRLDEFTECVDDVNSTFYNKVVNRMQVGNFDWKSSEKMLAVGAEYELGIFAAYNSYPVRRGNGSCIFLHVWKDANSWTAGCTAMEKSNLEKILAWADPKKSPYLVQLPETEYSAYQTKWNLPKLKKP